MNQELEKAYKRARSRADSKRSQCRIKIDVSVGSPYHTYQLAIRRLYKSAEDGTIPMQKAIEKLNLAKLVIKVEDNKAIVDLKDVDPYEASETGCLNFRCYSVKSNLCCAYCSKINKCKNACLNSPSKCGLLSTLGVMRPYEQRSRT